MRGDRAEVEQLRAGIAIRERFDAPRVKQAILVGATRRLIDDRAGAWNVRKSPAAAVSRTAPSLATA